jgi:alkanesulfonate monooxygenase SsuD/methylene tetrahydromethanopterin reductase-like flavin-dependent oxidoreductase (luciferase family)
VWHGSASSTESTELAARWGDPVFSANGFHPMEKYAALIRHYRERWAAYGHRPEDALVAAGFLGLLVADTTQQALRLYEPAFEAFRRSPGALHNRLPFTTVEEYARDSSALIGSPQQVIDKIGRYHAAFGHEVSGISLDVPGLPEAVTRGSLERFFTDIAPTVRLAHPSQREFRHPVTA